MEHAYVLVDGSGGVYRLYTAYPAWAETIDEILDHINSDTECARPALHHTAL